MIPNNVGSNSNLADGPVAMTVPANLKTLIRMIMRAFYGFELYLCMEMLMIYPCIKEEDLADLLRLDLKGVHQHLINLKKEKFVNERSIMETTADGRQSKHSYFYINYKMMVNVIKYKLDKIRIQIESEEKQCTSRANFKCTHCHKTYSDLDTKDIFLTMTCIYCNSEVEEDLSCMPNRSSRNLLAKFNTQMEIVFELLSRVEHVRLADDILRPEPIDISHILERMNNTSGSSANQNQPGATKNGQNGKLNGVKFDSMGNMKWSGDKTRNVDLFSQTKISINFDLSDNSSKTNSKQPKELPSILLLNQTNEDDLDMNTSNRDSLLLNSVKLAANETLENLNSTKHLTDLAAPTTLSPSFSNETTNSSNQITNNKSTSNSNSNNLELIIMQKLLIHEKKVTSGSCVDSTSTNVASPSSNLNANNSSPNIANKKRDYESTLSDLNGHKSLNGYSEHKNGHHLNGAINGLNEHYLNDQYENKSLISKKRKLNNGEILADDRNGTSKHPNGRNFHYPNGQNLHHQKSYSDGSDREVDEQDDEYYNGEENEDYNDQCIPRVTVQNKYYRLDKIDQYLINLMSENEKDLYINICRELYTEVYEN